MLDHLSLTSFKQEQVSRAPASKCCFGHQLLDRFRPPTIEQFEHPPPRFPHYLSHNLSHWRMR
jgi:hypothetical protein